MRLNKNIFLLVLVIYFGCTEPFKLVTESFEDTLVIEATITDELKTQKIKVSRTYRLESDTLAIEKEAKVKIVDSNNKEYDFVHEGLGVYNSTQEFQAVEGVTYKLFITTSEGKEYVSNEETLAPKAEMNLYAEELNTDGETGIQVFVDSYNDSGDANYFRYEYEETYKIVAPLFTPNDILLKNIIYIDDGTPEGDVSYDIEIISRSLDRKICYTTKNSNKIIITNVNGLSEDKISKFPIRFLPSRSSLLRERYTILVKQYVQSANANNFYKILKELGSDESLLIDNQPGFIQGNIFSNQNPKEKVIGFFDVSSITSKRIYFNYKDFNFEYPKYFYDCDQSNLDRNNKKQRADILSFVLGGTYEHVVTSTDSGFSIFAIAECVDCTVFSSNIKPEFWEE